MTFTFDNYMYKAPPPEPKPKPLPFTGKRMVRVGKWTGKKRPSKQSVAVVETFLMKYFLTEKIWTRKEHSSYVVAVRESQKNTEEVEAFRFNRTMEQRFVFTECKNGQVEIQLQPLEVMP